MMKDKGPNVKFPPPLMIIICLGLGYTVHYFWPTKFIFQNVTMILGIINLIIALILILGCCFQFLKAKTHLEPWRESKTLITWGMLRFSRNPIYLGFFFLGFSLSFFMNSLWVLLSLIPFYFLLHYCVIRKEEKYLNDKFKQQYQQYCKKVRRWL